MCHRSGIKRAKQEKFCFLYLTSSFTYFTITLSCVSIPLPVDLSTRKQYQDHYYRYQYSTNSTFTCSPTQQYRNQTTHNGIFKQACNVRICVVLCFEP